jgi:PAS domain-containing protein
MIFTELSEIKKLQDELKKTNENLEKTVVKRTEQVLKSNELLTAEILERKRAEEELKISEKKYHDLIYYAPAGIYEVDFRTKKFITVNDAMCQMSGYTRDELLNMSPFDILDKEGKKMFRKRISMWLSGEKPEENAE